MASKDIEQFACAIDKAISEAVATAKNDYQERLKAVEEIYGYPDIVIQASGATRSSLAQGGVDEMRRGQREQANAIGAQIQKVDEKLTSLQGDPAVTADILYLTDKLDGWIKRVAEIEIPKGAHTSSYPASPTGTMVSIQKKWKDFCENDPIVQKAHLYERKAKLETEIGSLTTTITNLENKLSDLKTEYEDRSSNPAKYEQIVQAEVDRQVSDISTELRHAQEDVTDLINLEKSLTTQLTTAGIFAFGKKKDLKAQIESLSGDIETARSKVSDIEKKMQAVKDNLPKKIAALADTLSRIRVEIETGEKLLADSKASLIEKQNELNNVVAGL